MKANTLRFSTAVVLVTCLAVCLATQTLTAEDRALKDVYADHFKIGAALSTNQVMGGEPAAMDLAARQFNTITPENLLKWAEVHPKPEQYELEPVNRFVEFGERNGMFLVGHTLVWHQQTPRWVFVDETGKEVDRETLLARMRDHIQHVVGTYKGRIHGWDVVNEAFEDDGRLRKTPWQRIIGDDYIEKAFAFAHEADPDAELYYNDFNMWYPGKRRAVAALVRDLKAKGIPIHGIGLQGHWGLDYPSNEEVQETLRDYGRLGVKLMVTELDMQMLPTPGQRGADISQNYELRRELDPYADGLPDAMQQQLAARYAEFFRILLRHSDKIDRVTFWGVHDGQSWHNNWPVRGRTAYPLLFDRQYQPKAAFGAVIDVAKQ